MMNSLFRLVPLSILPLLLLGCERSPKFEFQGKWQSLNDKNLVIEIGENNAYTLFRNGQSLYEGIPEIGELSIAIEPTGDPWYAFVVNDLTNGKPFTQGRIETVLPDRIRIYFHKHHDILDLADEFHRVNDLESFDRVMEDILNQPE